MLLPAFLKILVKLKRPRDDVSPPRSEFLLGRRCRCVLLHVLLEARFVPVLELRHLGFLFWCQHLEKLIFDTSLLHDQLSHQLRILSRESANLCFIKSCRLF